MPIAVIFGAGKIGRGFIGHLLHRAGYELHFVDASAALVHLLCERGAYSVHVAGRPAADERIPVADAAVLSDPRWQAWLSGCDLAASCVGAAQLDSLCSVVRAPLRARTTTLDWLICENADRPAERMREHLGLADRLGLIETQVLRSGMDPTAEQQAADPLAVRVTDWWTLPCDADAFVRSLPAIPGLSPRSCFAHELRRKLYTFNGLNGPIAYLGAKYHHRFLHQAANDPRLQSLLDEVQAESAHGLITAYGFDPEEHRVFQALARSKYADAALRDSIERNAADLARKLGPHERLLGPAELCFDHDRFPHAYVQAIAAALHYPGAPEDAGTQAVRARLRDEGPGPTLAHFGGLATDHPLNRAIVERYRHEEAIA